MTGCSFFTETHENSGQIKEIEIAEQVITIDYEVPELTPNILVNQLGYLADSEKKVVFRGDIVSPVFRVINQKTGKTVYEGRVGEPLLDSQSGENYVTGSFSSIKDQGTYYIQMDGLGESYPFQIQSQLYENLMRDVNLEIYKIRFQEKNPEDLLWMMNYILLSYELYPEVFTDNDGTKDSGNQIPDMLDELKVQTEVLLDQFATAEEDSSQKDRKLEDATLQLQRIAILSKFAYAYKGFDVKYASVCLTAAEKAYQAMKAGDLYQEEEYRASEFYAATELYRSIGASKYRDTLLKYFADYGDTDSGGMLRFFGTLTYLDTKYRVNFQICNEQMERIMELTAAVTKSCRSNPMGVSLMKGEELGGILETSVYITVGASIINSHEYDMLLESYLHYFLGINQGAESYLKDYGYDYVKDGNLLEDSPVQKAQFLLLISGISSKWEE